MRYLLIILFSFSSIMCKDNKAINSPTFPDKESEFKKHNLSIGMLIDDKTGFSLIGYTYNMKQDELNEYFIGAGTAILAYTATIGWKHYYNKSKLKNISSVVSVQYVAHMGFMGFMPTASFTLEYDLLKWKKWRNKIKLGLFSFVMLSGDNSGDFGILPVIGLNFDF